MALYTLPTGEVIQTTVISHIDPTFVNKHDESMSTFDIVFLGGTTLSVWQKDLTRDKFLADLELLQ